MLGAHLLIGERRVLAGQAAGDTRVQLRIRFGISEGSANGRKRAPGPALPPRCTGPGVASSASLVKLPRRQQSRTAGEIALCRSEHDGLAETRSKSSVPSVQAPGGISGLRASAKGLLGSAVTQRGGP
jgi:hypothetical protein